MSKLQWRLYRQSDIYFKDLDAVVSLHAEQERALGRPMDMPNLMEKPVLEAWVAERNGVVVGGMYFEAVPEVCFFGMDPAVSASAARLAPVLAGRMKRRGFRLVRMEVPRWMGKNTATIADELASVGFVETDSYSEHFVFDMRDGARTPAVESIVSGVAN